MLNELGRIQVETDDQDNKYKHLATEGSVVIKNAAKIIEAVRSGGMESVDDALKISKQKIHELLGCVGENQSLRNGRLRVAIEKTVEAELLVGFFRTGKLLKLSEVQPCNDEEYIVGALSMAQELSRYCKRRACEGDNLSVLFCDAFLSAFNGSMVEFYFRNGPLRRKFDGLKYARKTIESVLFDLSLLPKRSDDSSEPPNKKPREDEAGISEVFSKRDFLDFSDLAEVKARLDAYDAKRENVIKTSRDIQKLSKQAIFSLHGGKKDDAKSKLEKAAEIAAEVLPIIVEHPSLRSGSYSNSLEEWAEGKLLYHWMDAKVILDRKSLNEGIGQELSCSEYVGALSDLTGETGRMAVVLAAKRDINQVKEIFQANSLIVMGLESIESNKFGNKFKAAVINMEKIDLLLYELCMIEKGGRILPKEIFKEDDKSD